MKTLVINDKEYKIQYGYNSFCDTDLMDRTNDLIMMFASNQVANDKDVIGMGKFKDLFTVIRELLYVGFQKHNPVDSLQAVGNLLDDYKAEETEEEKRGLFSLFSLLADELMSEGFFGDLMTEITSSIEQEMKKVTPLDHQKKQRKKN